MDLLGDLGAKDQLTAGKTGKQGLDLIVEYSMFRHGGLTAQVFSCSAIRKYRVERNGERIIS